MEHHQTQQPDPSAACTELPPEKLLIIGATDGGAPPNSTPNPESAIYTVAAPYLHRNNLHRSQPAPKQLAPKSVAVEEETTDADTCTESTIHTVAELNLQSAPKSGKLRRQNTEVPKLSAICEVDL